MNLFSLMAITLACLGMFGFSSYATHQRIKEIGVRKVLGVSVQNIVAFLLGGL
jgi:putative ABC transport system permease protein